MDDQNVGDDNNVWNQPDQSQFVAATTSQDIQENGYNDGVIQAIAPSQYEQQYHDLRPSSYFTGAYNMGGSQSDLYQAVHSTYGRVSPVQEYRELPSGSEGISSYSGVQADSGQLMQPSAVDSSTLPAGYQMILDPGNRLVAVQRVVSPADCSVSQSTLSLRAEGNEAGPSSITLQPVQTTNSVDGTHYVTVQVTSMPQYAGATNHGDEVSTTDGTPMMSTLDHDPNRDLDSEHAVSSISSVVQNHVNMIARKRHELEAFNGEPDTTQEDLQDFNPLHSTPVPRSYLVASSDLGQGGIHSTMSSTGLGTSNQMAVMDSTLDSQLSSTHDISMSTTSEANLDSAMERTVDSSAIPDEIAGPSHVSGNMVTGSDSALDPSYDSEDDDDFDEDGNKENDPQSSGIRMPNNVNVRKSTRIALLDEEQSTSSQAWRKRVYVPRPYNTDELWCEECMTSYSPQCPVHRAIVVSDKIVLSRAWSSLPQMLQIYRFNSEVGPEIGVFAKKPVSKMTQFGPFVADMVSSQDDLTNTRFLLMLEKNDGTLGYFETSDENKCNWMMFVRPARNFAEQNVVAYQYGQDIYFTVMKNIEARQELKVWYSAHYGARIGIPIHEITERDKEAMDEQEYKFPCYECNKKFRSAPALQRHLVVHEEAGSPKHEDEDFIESAEVKGLRKKSLAARWFRNKGKQMKNGEGGESSGYQWKKKSTSIYLNKTLKKYQKRPDSEKIRRTIQSMYKRKGKETGGNEWVCMHCDLTFDNSSLLNLHTLTHAAEDVGLEEIQKLSSVAASITSENGEPSSDNGVVALNTILACPMCHAKFDDKNDLIAHATQHGTTKKKSLNALRPHKCTSCWKAFGTQERLNKHMLCHGSEESKPLECNVCHKRLMNNSAMACHMKIHSDKKYYSCPMCHEGFDQTHGLKEHCATHAVNGIYTCQVCQKQFPDFNQIRKHMRHLHSENEYPCLHCDKVFARPDKLKLHMLKHSTHREFMCENCGRQFKRKDKLKEHIKRMHIEQKETKITSSDERDKNLKKFVPKVLPTDYQRFIYKCHTCLLGFKRRGMLVNHLAKRHPDITPDLVPELNLPILKTQKDYYCQYCDKVYKSSSKRKSHIIKNHPGLDLPASSRKKSLTLDISGVPNPTYSQTVGSITTLPQQCVFCHKQYASKAKLMQHQRKKHPDLVPPSNDRRKSGCKEDQITTTTVQLVDPNQQQLEAYQEVTVTQVPQVHDLQAADLLTQAMSELTQTLQEYRPATGGDYHALAARIAQGVQGPAMVHVQPAQLQQLQHTTIELSHLGSTLAHAQITSSQPPQLIPAGTILTGTPQPPQSLSPQPQAPQAVPVSLVVTNPGTPNLATSVANGLPQNYVQGVRQNWQPYQGFR